MTVFVPLEHAESSSMPATPSFLAPPSHDGELQDVIQAILKARRIVVVSGAGISVKAGIPDFRSSNGLFTTLKKENPKEGLSSGKDLFDASVFNSEQSASLFYQMIARLADLSLEAQPTPFHTLLRTLDTRAQLLRLYTQNIDALEEKAGLSFGVPSFSDRPPSKRPRLESDFLNEGSTMKAEALPKCIPLHGTLQKMHCSLCSHSVEMAPYVSSLRKGDAPPCPQCTSLEVTRTLVGKRSRGVGILRPSVVLYGEIHREGEGVGEVVRRDLVGRGTGKGRGNKGCDLLIVVGTSLKVPGTKRIVREFSKAVKASSIPPVTETANSSDKERGYLPSPAPSPRRSPADRATPTPETKRQIRTVFLNYDFPLPSREWEGVFDVWVKGDAQDFARLVSEAIDAKNAIALLKKQKRENPSPLPKQKTKQTPSMASSPSPSPKSKIRPPISAPIPSPSPLPSKHKAKSKRPYQHEPQYFKIFPPMAPILPPLNTYSLTTRRRGLSLTSFPGSQEATSLLSFVHYPLSPPPSPSLSSGSKSRRPTLVPYLPILRRPKSNLADSIPDTALRFSSTLQAISQCRSTLYEDGQHTQ